MRHIYRTSLSFVTPISTVFPYQIWSVFDFPQTFSCFDSGDNDDDGDDGEF